MTDFTPPVRLSRLSPRRKARQPECVGGWPGGLSTVLRRRAARGVIRPALLRRSTVLSSCRTRTEGRVREVGRPQRPTKQSRAVRCSTRLEESRRVHGAIDRTLERWGVSSRTVAPGVSGSSPLGRPTNPASCGDGAPAGCSFRANLGPSRSLATRTEDSASSSKLRPIGDARSAPSVRGKAAGRSCKQS